MMDRIKKWIEKTGGTYIIVENDQPKLVVLDISSYERLIGGRQEPGNPGNEEREINQKIEAINQPEKTQAEDIINGLR